MLLFVTMLHIILCVILMLVILLQPGKGSDVGAAFGGGGGSSTIFGPRGAGNFLSKATTVVAVLFMITSVTLAIYSNTAMRSGSDIDDEIRRLMKEGGLATETYTVPEDRRKPVLEEEVEELEEEDIEFEPVLPTEEEVELGTEILPELESEGQDDGEPTEEQAATPEEAPAEAPSEQAAPAE